MNDTKLPALVGDLLLPDRYDPAPERVELVQTHASWVFLAGDLVYKVKKPVNYGFLDFSTLKKRRFYCREELRLNRRLGGDYYLEVESVVCREGRYYFGGRGEVVDYAVVMRRLPEEFLMRRLLAEGRLEAADLAGLVELLCDFYRRAPVYTDGRFGTRRKVEFDVEENFSQTADFVNRTIKPADYRRICDFSREFLQRNHKLFVRRVREGAVREGHGDLHMEHVCLVPGAPLVFDCIEFNQRFRRLDIVNDLAFLAMDLEENNRFDLAAAFIAGCCRELGELFEPRLLAFYKCYRAYVRGKVISFLSADENLDQKARNEARERAARYFRLAAVYAGPPPSGLILMAGVSGSGKSWLARAMHDLWGIKWLRSDEVRKELFGLTGQHAAAPFGEGIYTREATVKTYRLLAEKAREVIEKGEAVIVDATNLKAGDRKLFTAMASSLQVPVHLVVCRAPRAVLEENLRRRKEEGDVSDADLAIARRQRFEPPAPEELEQLSWLEIDTGRDLVEQLYQLISGSRE
jgi:aminoglycoside phosphotransferase family enzyme/predicted kinase